LLLKLLVFSNSLGSLVCFLALFVRSVDDLCVNVLLSFQQELEYNIDKSGIRR
jgi:hypothetical protein